MIVSDPNGRPVHRLCWSFGEPREEAGQLVVPFYYQIGRHVELQLPWPTPRFSGAGGLAIQVGNALPSAAYTGKWDPYAVEIGQRLYESLGPEAQSTLIRTFANRSTNGSPRVLLLQFSTPQSQRSEIDLALEDLPWELLHDGETFIAWRYGLQIVRSHARDTELFPHEVHLSSWGILMVSPFVNASEERCRQAGLEPLPAAQKELTSLRDLQRQTKGLVRVLPGGGRGPGGIATFEELGRVLQTAPLSSIQIIHFMGHGMVFHEEPCLCFESEDGQVDYVSVGRMRRMLQRLQEERGPEVLPQVFFLNACSSSSRGRYSAGFASGLHDLGLTVVGYQSEIRDDFRPQLAAEQFYRSLCVEQALQNPHRPPNVVTAIDAARRSLRGGANDESAVWGRLRAYIPAGVHFYIEGRGFLERKVQSLYARFAQWMNPIDYTDHLSLVFLLAIVFGILFGTLNLAFVLPEGVWQRHLTYSEIVSELTRIFLVGPLSFLAGSFIVALQTRFNHRDLVASERPQSAVGRGMRMFNQLGVMVLNGLLAGGLFALLFSYSFARLDLLTNQTMELANLLLISVDTFWYGLVGLLGAALALSLMLSSLFNRYSRESLHSYRSFYVLAIFLLLLGAIIGGIVLGGIESSVHRKLAWGAGAIVLIAGYCTASVKILKEVGWRSAKKRDASQAFSWRKFIPLLGGIGLLILGYFLLEESVRFEQNTIQQALQNREVIEEPIESENVRNRAIIERALRQRAIQSIPETVKQRAEDDWLLNVVTADSTLVQALREEDPAMRYTLLTQAQSSLNEAAKQHPEVRYTDYYANIKAMALLLLAQQKVDPIEQRRLLNDAVEFAHLAVRKDPENFAYLDTLARAETHLAILNEDQAMLREALQHSHQAQWSAFFLRSPRGDEVRRSIGNLKNKIEQSLDEMQQRQDQAPPDHSGFPTKPIVPQQE